jgi:hypothetical protein
MKAYLDDSGTDGRSPILVLGGWIAPAATWADKFVPAWNEMLNMRPRIDYFKMSEVDRLQGQFQFWSEQRRDERVALAYKIIEEHIPYQVSIVLELESYRRIFTADQYEDAIRNPYYFAFGAAVTGIARKQEKYGIQKSP